MIARYITLELNLITVMYLTAVYRALPASNDTPKTLPLCGWAFYILGTEDQRNK
jgi:hypothetical protein